jgi:formylglycine-generating enzyme required for sulfatase activity
MTQNEFASAPGAVLPETAPKSSPNPNPPVPDKEFTEKPQPQRPPHVWTSPSTSKVFAGIEGGEFMLGRPDGEYHEKPRHKVRISRFYMGVMEVARRQCRPLLSVGFSVLEYP